MLTDYPDSTLVPQAKQRLRDVQEVLASREADIAAFYATRQNLMAVIARYQTVVDTYPLYSHMDDVLIGLGDAYEAQARFVRCEPADCRKVRRRSWNSAMTAEAAGLLSQGGAGACRGAARGGCEGPAGGDESADSEPDTGAAAGERGSGKQPQRVPDVGSRSRCFFCTSRIRCWLRIAATRA